MVPCVLGNQRSADGVLTHSRPGTRATHAHCSDLQDLGQKNVAEVVADYGSDYGISMNAVDICGCCGYLWMLIGC